MADHDRAHEPSTQVALGPARLREAAALAAMSRDHIEAGLGWRWRPKSVSALLLSHQHVTVVARTGNRPVGFATLELRGDRGHLVLLAVDPGVRRAGIGNRMHRWLEQFALAAGVVEIGLEVRAENRAARSFYLQLGYRSWREIPGYYRGVEAAVCMRRALVDERVAERRANQARRMVGELIAEQLAALRR